MSSQRLMSALLTIGLCSASALKAQSTVFRDPQSDSPSVETRSKLTPMRALVAINESRINALDYLYNHPVCVSPNPQQHAYMAIPQSVPLQTAPPAAKRFECPMSVSNPAVTNDSMAVRSSSTRSVEAMPVSPSPCTNPLNTNP